MKKIYFDLDGVMANFELAVVEHTGMHYWDRTTNASSYWHILETVPNLYYNLEVIPGAWTMFNEVYKKHGPDVVEVLTGCPKPTGLLATSSSDKKLWVRDVINDEVKVNTIVGGINKYLYLEENPGSLLIDDYLRNIKSWIAAGGVGILHTDAPSTIAKLKVLGLL